MLGPTLFAILIALSILFIFIAIWRFAPRRDPVVDRLEDYGLDENTLLAEGRAPGERTRFWRLNQLINGNEFGRPLASALVQADLPLTAAEFILITLAAALLGFALGATRVNAAVGVFLGVLLALVPVFYLRTALSRRRREFTNQLPDVLTLMVGALRAGYGLTQSIELLVDEMPPPASVEFGRVMRAISLGVPVQRALANMAQRVGSDDLDLVVTAISVQYEMGGNLAQILETIGNTVRERIRVLREIRVLTAQQRLTGTILGLLPIGIVVMLIITSPGYFDPFFDPGLIRLLPALGAVMMVIGFFLIRRIVDIEV